MTTAALSKLTVSCAMPFLGFLNVREKSKPAFLSELRCSSVIGQDLFGGAALQMQKK